MHFDITFLTIWLNVAIDQGGCFDTSRPTTHQDPTFVVDGITHYCVANMPGAVAQTSTMALTNATLPYVLTLANKGVKNALLEDENFLKGLNVCNGKLTCKEAADALGIEHHDAAECLRTLHWKQSA